MNMACTHNWSEKNGNEQDARESWREGRERTKIGGENENQSKWVVKQKKNQRTKAQAGEYLFRLFCTKYDIFSR